MSEMFAMLRCVRPGGILTVTLDGLQISHPVSFGLALEHNYEIEIAPKYIHSETEVLIRAHTFQLEKQARSLGKSVKVLFWKVESAVLQVAYQILEDIPQNTPELEKMSHIFLSCTQCPFRKAVMVRDSLDHHHEEDCPECSSKMTSGGPLYSGTLIEHGFVQSLHTSLKSKYIQRYLSGTAYLNDVLQNLMHCSDSRAGLPRTRSDAVVTYQQGYLTAANMSKIQFYFARALTKVHLQV